MAFTDDELIAVRSWVPWETDDAALDAAHDRLGSLWAVVVERLRARRASLVANPAVFGVGGGEYSQNVTENIKALERDIEQAEKYLAAETAAASGGIVHVRLERRDPVRNTPRSYGSRGRRADASI